MGSYMIIASCRWLFAATLVLAAAMPCRADDSDDDNRVESLKHTNHRIVRQ